MSYSASFLDLQSLNQQDLPNLCYNAAGKLILASTIDAEIVSPFRKPNLQEKAHLRLAFYWLKVYQPDENASNLEKVRGYVEAFYHFCQISAWSVAWQVLQLPVTTGKKFCEQFKQWGYYREQVEIYPALLGKINSETDCNLYDYLGNAYYSLGQAQKALETYQQQLDLAQQIQSPYFEASALNGLGLTLGQLGQYKQAITYHQKELEIAKSLNNPILTIQALRGLGIAHGRNINYQKAVFYLKQALALSEQQNNDNLSNLISISLGEYLIYFGKPKLGLTYLELALAFFEENNGSHEICHTLQCCSSAFLSQNQSENSWDCLSKALEISKRENYYSEVAVILNNIGIQQAYFQKKYDAAIPSFKECHWYYKVTNNQRIVSIILSNISYCYGCLKQTSIATRYAKKAIALARKYQNKEAEAIGLAILGNAYWHSGKRIIGISLALRAATMLPPWRSANGKLIVKNTINKVFGFLKR
ncbi:MAG: tetratricopeptide repeat protein [Spirulinaceae cyanobacterium]